jgi:hypothetical protein
MRHCLVVQRNLYWLMIGGKLYGFCFLYYTHIVDIKMHRQKRMDCNTDLITLIKLTKPNVQQQQKKKKILGIY